MKSGKESSGRRGGVRKGNWRNKDSRGERGTMDVGLNQNDPDTAPQANCGLIPRKKERTIKLKKEEGNNLQTLLEKDQLNRTSRLTAELLEKEMTLEKPGEGITERRFRIGRRNRPQTGRKGRESRTPNTETEEGSRIMNRKIGETALIHPPWKRKE